MTADRRVFLQASLMTALAGCARQGPFRANAKTCETSADTVKLCGRYAHILAKQSSLYDLAYSIGVVEFDDQGVLLNERQLWFACNKVKEITEAGRDVAVVVYVHGWHHNAFEEDADFASFNLLLADIAALEATKPAQRHVVGIYAAWPGLGIMVPGIKYAGFWTRKAAAERVAQGSILELFAQVRQIWRDRNCAGGDSRLMIIGHSFGGLIVYQALRNYFVEGVTTGPTKSQTRAEKMQDQLLNQRVDGYGNLVILINPAFEGVRYEVINRIVNERDQFAPNQKPVLAIFASRNDYPVRYFFPLGRWASTPLQRLASDASDDERAALQAKRTRQSDKVIYGVGYVDEFITHRLDRKGPPNPRYAVDQLTQARLSEREMVEAQQLSDFNSAWSEQGYLNKGWSRQYTDGTVLTHKGKFPNNPFYVVKVDAALIDGHSGIWENQQWLDFLRQFYDEAVDHSPGGRAACPGADTADRAPPATAPAESGLVGSTAAGRVAEPADLGSGR